MKIVRRYKAYMKRLNKRRSRALQRLYKRRVRPNIKRVSRIIASPAFGKTYLAVAIMILAATATFWSVLGARINWQNADQLINAFLFEKPSVFHDALLPGSHSFLLKWPLFLLIKELGFTPGAYIAVTVSSVLVTLGAFVWILYRIDRRPLVLGTIILALASVLMLVPTTPYPGALLPVNMAMLATRNIEYIVYIAAFGLLVRIRHLRSWSFAGAVVLLAILFSSDKLFLFLALGGMGAALTAYGVMSGWSLVKSTSRWMLAAILGAAASTFILFVINGRVAHIVSGQGIGPYGVDQNLHSILLGCIYALLHILTNFGANPASQTMVLRDVPQAAAHQLTGLSGFSYLINIFLFGFALWAIANIMRNSFTHNKDPQFRLTHPGKLAVALIWSSIAAIIIFVLSNHYFAADARYLAVVLFAATLAVAAYFSQKIVQPLVLVCIGLASTIGIILAIPSGMRGYQAGQTALTEVHQRNDRIAQALQQHPVQTLVGDYWRVIPIKFLHKTQDVLPLGNCTQPRDTLSSAAWQKNLQKSSFAYILTLDGSLTDFPHCTPEQILATYGRPNASMVTAGSVKSPKEMLWFYDKGAGHSAPAMNVQGQSTTAPVELADITNTTCKQPTIMNIVAHEDDDLLFMNPDLQHDIQAGNCIRTIYVTAGDSGQNLFYWLGREQGSEAAYAKMLNHDDIWVERVVHIAKDEYATVANPRGDSRISLIYIHLPDGNMHGQGFASHGYESLAKLNDGKLHEIHDVYNGSSYTSDELKSALKDMMQLYQPAEIHTQAHYPGSHYTDHSDHMAVGSIVQQAYAEYQNEHYAGKVIIPVKFYIGYPIHEMPVNLSPEEVSQKANIFSIYSSFDGSVCHSDVQCRHDPAYGAYIQRQYQNPY